MVIRILDHVRTASSYDDGNVIFDLIVNDIREGRPVHVSFEGVTSVPSAFVNAAFVRLLESMPFSHVQKSLRIEKSTKQINDLVRTRFAFVAGHAASQT